MKANRGRNLLNFLNFFSVESLSKKENLVSLAFPENHFCVSCISVCSLPYAYVMLNSYLVLERLSGHQVQKLISMGRFFDVVWY